jgi:hypothetical protein
MYICTLFTDSHLSHALTLWESVFHYGKQWSFLALRISGGQLPETVPREFRECCVDLAILSTAQMGPRFWYEPFEFCITRNVWCMSICGITRMRMNGGLSMRTAGFLGILQNLA